MEVCPMKTALFSRSGYPALVCYIPGMPLLGAGVWDSLRHLDKLGICPLQHIQATSEVRVRGRGQPNSDSGHAR